MSRVLVEMRLLDYETDEETSANRARFVNDDDTLSSGPFDGMDDYNYNDSTLGQTHATMDVHICQSSLCEACEHDGSTQWNLICQDGGAKFTRATAGKFHKRILCKRYSLAVRNECRNYWVYMLYSKVV